MAKTLCIMTTHFINEAIISEYAKLARSTKCDAILAIDNHALKSTEKNGVHRFFDTEVNCFYFDEKIHDELQLPYYPSNDFGRVQWYNCDYRFYYIRKYFNDYEYYWQFENDVFFNTASNSYDKFLETYENNDHDLIVSGFSLIDRKKSTWYWIAHNDWIYQKQTNFYRSFFPIERLSAKAVDFLYQKRLEHSQIYVNSKDQDKRWVHCELFVPTELANNGFKCIALQEPYVKLTPLINFNNNRLFLKPDEHCYHPVKCSSELPENNNESTKLKIRKILLTSYVELLYAQCKLNIRNLNIVYAKNFSWVQIQLLDKYVHYEYIFSNENTIRIALHFEGDLYKEKAEFLVEQFCNFKKAINTTLVYNHNIYEKEFCYITQEIEDINYVASLMNFLIEQTYDILVTNHCVSDKVFFALRQNLR